MSYLDGPDEDIYVYDDKIVVEENGLEPQLKGHIQGNLNLGNDKAFLTNVVLQCVPYMGYPRSLNALACINKIED